MILSAHVRDRFHVALTLLCCGGFGMVVAPAFAAAIHPDVVAPTSALTPAQIDRVWAQSRAPFAASLRSELDQIERVNAQGPFRADWEGLEPYRVPEWYRDAKFGIFIHWGVYSVPAFGNEWYPRLMYQEGSADWKHHVATYGSPEKFGYKDFIPLFRGEHFDPRAWVALFRDAGARYVVPVAEHHDGFAMYDSHMSSWTSVLMGPHRDVVGELAKAARAEGLRFGVSSHLAEHNFFYEEGRKIRSDVNDPRYASFYGPAHKRILMSSDDADVITDYTPISQMWQDEWLARSAELVDLYHPDLVYFDWWIGHPQFRGTLPKFLAYYYNTRHARTPDDEGVVNYKQNGFMPGTGVLDIERGVADGIQAQPWQTCTFVTTKAWGYVKGDHARKADVLLQLLVDVVSKNGNLLLNVGPRADGTIPEDVATTLRDMGQWLTRNGEAIYGTRPWRVFGEGPTRLPTGSFAEAHGQHYTSADFRFTRRDATIFAIAMGRPAGRLTLHSFHPDDGVQAVSLLGGGVVPFTVDATGLHIDARGFGLSAMPVFRVTTRS
ncbi:alpha-L-fucosidase [Brytella acorum]|uniref:alpha-L-fucosidase n=1 Tax=Brytella acorum TaxID=2959299 RepID=A0AA35UTW9_9PROT|nr:alpha-L-fucosidase [Brytella acorum]MDF3625208.1 alpha-L-fucosidase [Brytella acorum]CAI9119380.1 alpha-L-fucosidase [Brytella acorum]